MSYRYVPQEGDRRKLRTFFHYTELSLPVWSHLKVLKVEGEDVTVEVLNGDAPTGRICIVPLRYVQPPIGWKSVYHIVADSLQEAHRVVEDWFGRGIHVWANHDLGAAGQAAYTPVSGVPKSPGWQFTANPVETVTAADCPDRFTVSWEEVRSQHQFDLPDADDAAARKKAIRALKKDGWRVCRTGRVWEARRKHRIYPEKAGLVEASRAN